MAKRSTYIRKIGLAQYEYGFLTRAKNFRKQNDRYEPAGVRETVSAAEDARSDLELLAA